jgi:oligopeptide/dipeptide ABC transporter ATP-binding protein
MPLLEVSNLRTYFRTDAGEARAVDGLSFAIDRGEVLGIVGESGSGKSVTSLSLMRLIPDPPGRIMDGSSIQFKGEELTTASDSRMRELRGSAMAMIFQEPMTSLNPVHRVGEQIAEAVRLHRKSNRKDARERAVEMLRLVGLPDPEERVDVYPHQLSGGQRQRVMIAMALSCEPDLLIADEPTTALDVTIQAQILDLLAQLRERMGMAMILITHDLGVVAEVCDRVIVMYAGQVVEHGTVEEIFRDPRHPYTQGLLQSIPKLGHPVERLAVIPGIVPSPVNWPIGCRFHTRCPYGWDLCVKEQPAIFHVSADHGSRCWLEKYPERRQEIDDAGRGFTSIKRADELTPAEAYHRRAAIADARMHAPEVAPPYAAPNPLADQDNIDRDVNR